MPQYIHYHSRRDALYEKQRAVETLEVLRDSEISEVEVNVLPAEPQGFTLSQPHSECDRVEGSQAVSLYGREKFPGLIRAERLDFELLHSRTVHQLRNIPRNELPFDGLVEGRSQCSQQVTHCLWFQTHLALVVDQSLHLLRRQPLKRYTPKCWLEMHANVDLVSLESPWSDVRSDYVDEPLL